MLICQCCKEEKKLVKAHVIPEAFFRVMREDKGTPLLVSGAEIFTERKPIGVYDEGILCEECESDLKEIDSYGISILLEQIDNKFYKIGNNFEILGYESNLVDKGRLLQFLVSVLWRASISTHKFYKHVKLGKYEETAKEISFSKRPTDFHVFDSLLSRWDNRDVSFLGYPILDPRLEKFDHVNSYRVYFGEVIAYIKVDSRPFPEKLRSNSLLHAHATRMISRDMRGSKDYIAMANTANRSVNNLRKFRRLHYANKPKET